MGEHCAALKAFLHHRAPAARRVPGRAQKKEKRRLLKEKAKGWATARASVPDSHPNRGMGRASARLTGKAEGRMAGGKSSADRNRKKRIRG